MTPDSSEGRERITRMEVQVDANKRQIETLMPLSLQVGVMAERLDSLREDLHEAERENDRRLERHERRIDSKLEDMARSFGNQMAACSSQVAEVAKAQREYHEAEQKRRETAHASRRDDRTSRRAMWALLGAAAITGILTFAATLVQAIVG